jgi:glutaredoxin-like protein NrdH
LVTIYTNPQCQPCRFTKKRLDDRGIEYRVVDLSEDPEALKYVTEELGHREAPVVVANGLHWSGLRVDLIDAI